MTVPTRRISTISRLAYFRFLDAADLDREEDLEVIWNDIIDILSLAFPEIENHRAEFHAPIDGKGGASCRE